MPKPDSDEIRTTAEAHEDTAMPCAHSVHTEPLMPCTAEHMPLPAALARRPVEQKSPAEWAYERLILYIQNFEERLDNEHEIAMGFAGADAGILRIEGIGYFDPDIITFYGSDDNGTKTQLVQHVSQLNVLLQSFPKRQQGAEPSRIGFRLVADLEKR